jgi:hypothetical protein
MPGRPVELGRSWQAVGKGKNVPEIRVKYQSPEMSLRKGLEEGSQEILSSKNKMHTEQ